MKNFNKMLILAGLALVSKMSYTLDATVRPTARADNYNYDFLVRDLALTLAMADDVDTGQQAFRQGPNNGEIIINTGHAIFRNAAGRPIEDVIRNNLSNILASDFINESRAATARGNLDLANRFETMAAEARLQGDIARAEMYEESARHFRALGPVA